MNLLTECRRLAPKERAPPSPPLDRHVLALLLRSEEDVVREVKAVHVETALASLALLVSLDVAERNLQRLSDAMEDELVVGQVQRAGNSHVAAVAVWVEERSVHLEREQQSNKREHD